MKYKKTKIKETMISVRTSWFTEDGMYQLVQTAMKGRDRKRYHVLTRTHDGGWVDLNDKQYSTMLAAEGAIEEHRENLKDETYHTT